MSQKHPQRGDGIGGHQSLGTALSSAILSRSRLWRTVENASLADLFDGIVLNVLGRSEDDVVLVIATGIVALAGIVFAADHRARFVYPAHVVGLEVFAVGRNLDVPVAIFDEHRNAFVHDVPAHVVKVAAIGRFFNRKRDVPAACPRAMFTQY